MMNTFEVFMFSKKLKIIVFGFLFVILSMKGCFAAEQPAKVKDDFIVEFLKKVDSTKISYDGKELTLYACSSKSEYILAALGLLFWGFLECACLVSDDEHALFIGILFFIMFAPVPLLLLCRNLYYDINDIPIVKINDEEVQYWNDKKVKWDKVERLKMFNAFQRYGDFISSYSGIQLCDKFLNTLLTVSNENMRLPIHPDNLYAVLEHYLAKNKAIAG